MSWGGLRAACRGDSYTMVWCWRVVGCRSWEWGWRPEPELPKPRLTGITSFKHNPDSISDKNFKLKPVYSFSEYTSLGYKSCGLKTLGFLMEKKPLELQAILKFTSQGNSGIDSQRGVSIWVRAQQHDTQHHTSAENYRHNYWIAIHSVYIICTYHTKMINTFQML